MDREIERLRSHLTTSATQTYTGTWNGGVALIIKLEQFWKIPVKSQRGISMLAKPRLPKVLAATFIAVGGFGITTASADGPTCSATFGLANHAQHIIGDYVTGIGGIGGPLSWPPNKGVVGAKNKDNGGAFVRGGPGPAFHFLNNFAPGASLCTDSRSPGMHFLP